MSRVLKLNPPAVLPSSGVTSVSFKAWQRQLVAYLEQDVNSPHFLPHGLYANWRARGKNRARIPELHVDDQDRVAIMDRLTAALAARHERPNDRRADQYTQVDRDRDLATLLQSRNAQLSKFITLITVLCPYTLTNNLDQLSTSFTWIITYLEQHYHIQKAGAHFLSISEIRFDPADSYENFYMELHGAVEDSLRKRGELLLFRNSEPLEEDEEMSPTLENMIVLLWLERIDPRLPKKVSDTFAHQMVGNTSLRDLQPTISARLPGLLQELDEAAANRAALHAADMPDIDPPVAAAFTTRGQNRNRGGQRRTNFQKGKQITKFCRICFLLNKGSPNVYTSHNITNCNKLSDRDKQEMARGAAISLDDAGDPDTPLPIPGWDTDED
jgi:hypothetical protein